MAITSITVEASEQSLSREGTRENLERYLDHLDDALTAAYPDAEITVREGTTQTQIVADTDDEQHDVAAFIQAHFERGEWFQQ